MKVSVIVRCARTYGLLEPLRALTEQRFDGDWEIIVVDWLYEERQELLAGWYDGLAADEYHSFFPHRVPLIHVPPLPPLAARDGKYHAWDLCLSFNTGLAHARGDVVMHLEDHWVVRPNWVQTFYDLVTENPSCVVFGDKMAEPPFDDAAPGHYGLVRNPEERIAPLRDVRSAVFVNFAHRLEPFLRCSYPEWPGRWPEMYWTDQLRRCEMTAASTNLAPAWHKSHPPGGGIVRYVSRMEGGLLQYEEKHGAEQGASSAYAPELQIPTDLEPYRRDLMAERKRLGVG